MCGGVEDEWGKRSGSESVSLCVGVVGEQGTRSGVSDVQQCFCLHVLGMHPTNQKFLGGILNEMRTVPG